MSRFTIVAIVLLGCSAVSARPAHGLQYSAAAQAVRARSSDGPPGRSRISRPAPRAPPAHTASPPLCPSSQAALASSSAAKPAAYDPVYAPANAYGKAAPATKYAPAYGYEREWHTQQAIRSCWGSSRGRAGSLGSMRLPGCPPSVAGDGR